MEESDLLNNLRKEAERWLETQGLNIVFQIIEIDQQCTLVLHDHLISKILLFLGIDDKKSLSWKLDLDAIYKKGLQITDEDGFLKNAKYRDGGIDLPGYYSFAFGFHFILTQIPIIAIIAHYVLSNTYIDCVKISNFFSINNIVLNKINGTKEIYFLGENGDGKSLILMGIYLAFNNRFIQQRTAKKFTGKVIDLIEKDKKNLQLKAIDTNSLEYGDNFYFKNFFAYGVHRGRYSTDNPEQYGFMSLFDNNLELINPVSWLKQLYLLEFEKFSNTDILNQRKKVFNIIEIKIIEELFEIILEKNVKIEVKADGVKFIEKGFPLTFDQLSEGHKNLIIWVCDLIYRLHENEPGTEKLNEFCGVVMVDEIELHLHPKWQRTLVGKLRKFFPNIQFIFTTHSPTIIQGASDEAIIYRVYRDVETGHTHVSEPYYKKDLDDLMLNSLVTSPLFGLEDARLTDKPVRPDTSDSYTLYRINKRVEARLAEQKKNGKAFVTDDEIDSLIDQILKEDNADDQNK